MPCYRCGVRQTDPGRGQSPWKRGVWRNSQVLICPGCQDAADWTADLDRCASCGSVHLVRRLGEVECRDCGAIAPPSGDGPPGEGLSGEALSGGRDGDRLAGLPGPVTVTDTTRSPDLSEEVARALERVLRQGLAGQIGHRAGSAEPC